MRGLIGAVVLGLGVAGLGYWGANAHAVRMQAKVSDGAAAAVAGAIHGVDTGVLGRDITVSGIADTEAERDALLAALDAVDGRRVVRDGLTVLPLVDPFTMDVQDDGTGPVLSGHVPREDTRAALAGLAGGADALTLASGAPGDWLAAAQAGLAALDPLENGRLEMSGTNVTLSGTALTPTERDAALAALAGLPGGYTSQTAFELIDDGRPPEFALDWNAASGASAEGKLPHGLERAAMAGALGLGDMGGDARPGLTGEGQGDGVQAILAGLAGWLPFLDTARLSYADGAASLDAALPPGADAELIGAALGEALPGVQITLGAAELPAEGTERTNAATGTAERLIAGYWLPVLGFEPGRAACGEMAAASLAEARIGFVSGSARLDARALRAVNRLAAVVRPCVLEAGLAAQLGGHTDNTGNPEANFRLSLARARAVKDALVARGVPEQSLRTVGYGDTEPVASNDTDEGRAANRRTTIDWY